MLGIIMPITAALLWGLYYAMAEQVLKGVSVTTYYALSCMFSCVGAFAFSYFVKEPISFDFLGSQKQTLMMLGLMMLAFVASLLIYYTIQDMSGSYAAIGECIYPIFVPFFAYFLWKETGFSQMQMVGSFIVVAGIGLVVYGQASSEDVEQIAKASDLLENAGLPEIQSAEDISKS